MGGTGGVEQYAPVSLGVALVFTAAMSADAVAAQYRITVPTNAVNDSIQYICSVHGFGNTFEFVDPVAPAAPPASPSHAGAGVRSEDVDHTAVPDALPDSAVLPWLRRRLTLATRAARRVGLAAVALEVAAK